MDKMDGMTMNIEQANVEKLKAVFPEVVCRRQSRL